MEQRAKGDLERGSHPSHGIVRGQSVQASKLVRSRELRKESTSEERLLWAALRANRLAGLHFRRQQVISGFIVDFYCDALSLAVELDGNSHRGREDYDHERDAALQRRGVRVLRFFNRQVRAHLPDVLAAIVEIAEEVTPAGGSARSLRKSLPSQGSLPLKRSGMGDLERGSPSETRP